MDRFLDSISISGNLLLVVLGFSLIILIHEAGHFFAAKWAGIRVMAFAMGFGPALVSYRKGMGVRRGSSDKEIQELQKDAQGFAGEKRERARSILASVSPTEYRWNILPFGGYVKMLGQDDADPTAVSDEPDSYQNCPPLKRMVVISAGVVANIVTAALMFIVVFRAGLSIEPAVVGDVEPGQPAALAIASNAAALGVTEPGLKPGDKIVTVNGVRPEHFNVARFHIVYAPPQTPVRMGIERPGVNGILDFSILPETVPGQGLLSIGIDPIASDTLVTSSSRRYRQQFAENMTAIGLPGLEAGMRLAEADGKPLKSVYELQKLVDTSNGRPISTVFVTPEGDRRTIPLKPEPSFQAREIALEGRGKIENRHLLGLTPVMSVRSVVAGEAAEKAGLKAGDVFVQLGDIEYPSVAAGIAEIRRSKDKPDAKVRVVVARPGADGAFTEVDLHEISAKDGTIGFHWSDAAATSNLTAAWPGMSGTGAAPSGAGLGKPAGSRITRVNDQDVATLGELRNVLQAEASRAVAGSPMTARLTWELPIANSDQKAIETVAWQIPADEVTALRQLGWETRLNSGFFEREKFRWRADSVGQSITMAVTETHRNMIMTLLTLKGLFQRTVSPENLKGPVGIAHVGISIVDKGLIWLLFYMGLISVNLAVINFLPIPITDGGHMIFLIYEQLTGRPPPVVVQNVATIAGLIVIGSLFLYVTFNDVTTAFTAITRFFGG